MLSKKFIPLFVVEFYLISTLLIFFFGPLSFKVHNFEVFVILMLLYHVSFIVGYYLASVGYSKDVCRLNFSFDNLRFYFIFAFATLACLITYKNVMLGTSLIPVDIFAQVARGISSPAEVYIERLEIINSGLYSTSRLINVTSVFFMFFKFLFIFYAIYFWKYLSLVKKVLFFIYCFLFVSPSLAGGINSILFYFIIFSFVSLFFVKLMRGEVRMLRVLVMLFFVLLIPVGFFGYIMSLRGGGFEFFNNISPLGDISINILTPALDSFYGFYLYSLVWISSYLVQGYYGFSLALGQDWIWTYGFGSSHFLQNQLLIIFGIDVSDLTFQARVSSFWDEKAMCHSFYGQVANDVSFVVTLPTFCPRWAVQRV